MVKYRQHRFIMESAIVLTYDRYLKIPAARHEFAPLRCSPRFGHDTTSQNALTP